MEEPIYTIVTTEQLIEQIDYNELLALDTETDGFYGRIISAQYYQRHWKKALILVYPSPLDVIIAAGNATLVFHSASYDISTIQRQSGTSWVPKFHDTLLLSRIGLYRLASHSLDMLIYNVTGKNIYKIYDVDKKEFQKKKWAKLPYLPVIFFNYAALDVLYLFKVFDKVKIAIESLSYQLDISSLTYLLQSQNNGVPLDTERLETIFFENEKIKESIRPPINCNAYQQVRLYLNIKESDKQALMTLAANLDEVEEPTAEQKDTLRKVKDILEYKRVDRLNTFIANYLKLGGDAVEPVITTVFKVCSKSGRSKSSKPNIQQIPRSLKTGLGYMKDSTKVIIYCDLAQFELKCIAAITQDQAMLERFYKGEDVHAFTAKNLFQEDYTPEQRQIAKTLNFNLLYGGGARMMQEILLLNTGKLMPIATLKQHTRNWKNLFSNIAAWQRHKSDLFRSTPIDKTPFGRKYTADMYTVFLNIENQGFGAEIAKLGLHYLKKRMEELGDTEIKLINFVHDSYIFSTEEGGDYDKICTYIGSCLKAAWAVGIQQAESVSIPMTLEIKIGKNWGDIEADKDIIYKKVIQ